VNEIKKAHDKYIINLRYFFDKIKNRDLILSISCEDSNIKIWCINTFECILNLRNIYENGNIFSACFLNDNYTNYIISSNYKYDIYYPIKIFDFKGEIIKELNDSKDLIFKVDSFFDENMSKNFIITCSYGFEKAYNFNDNSLYHKYQEENDSFPHFDFLLNENDNMVKLIESSEECIRIWNFHSGELLKKLSLDICFHMICLWDSDYLFAAEFKTINLIDLKKGIVMKTLTKHKNDVNNIKDIVHPKYGKCLLSQDCDGILLWINKIK
jgi:WD40 repeat protein